MTHKLLFALPCYNEADNIPPLLQKFDALNQSLENNLSVEVLIIDDCSRDHTESTVANLTSSTVIHYVKHEENKGLTGGINTAFHEFAQRATDPDYIAFGFMDGDNTQHPIAAIDMLSKIKAGNDVVIGSRYHPGSQVFGVNSLRRFYSFGLSCLFRMTYRIPHIKDYSCGFRLYSPRIIRKLAERYGSTVVSEKSFASAVELLLRAHHVGASFAESAFTLRYNDKIGASKMPYLKTIMGNLKLILHSKSIYN